MKILLVVSLLFTSTVLYAQTTASPQIADSVKVKLDSILKANPLPEKPPAKNAVKQTNLLGRATRLVLSCKDVIKNMSWWSRLGFVPAGAMTRPDSAMTLTDGQIVITLIKDPLPSPIIMFSTKDIRKLKDSLNLLGLPITYDVKGPSYGELRLISPNGVHLAVRSEQDEPVIPVSGDVNMICGTLGELSIGAAYLQREQQFWQTLGMEVRKSSLMPYPFSNVNDGVMEIGIHENRDILTLAMTYFSPDMAERIDRLKKSGVKFHEEIPSEGDVIENAILHSPEGQLVYMFKTID